MVNSQLFSKELNRQGRARWLRVGQLPFSRVYAYQLINSGTLSSVLLQLPNSKRGVRLIDSDSLDELLERMAREQASKKRAA